MKLIYQGTIPEVNIPSLKGGLMLKLGDAVDLSPADFGGDVKMYEDKCKELIASGNFREHKEYKPAPEFKTTTKDGKGAVTRKKNR